jgi:lipopolysaccharide export system protein LptA
MWVVLTGDPVHLQQEIEEQGLVKAKARRIEYQVSSGIVTLTGSADVEHPQYRISGEVLIYDMNEQHFQGSGGDNNGRIRIRLDPEVVPDLDPADNTNEAAVSDENTESDVPDPSDAEVESGDS